jgi:hypothetical protein
MPLVTHGGSETEKELGKSVHKIQLTRYMWHSVLLLLGCDDTLGE